MVIVGTDRTESAQFDHSLHSPLHSWLSSKCRIMASPFGCVGWSRPKTYFLFIYLFFFFFWYNLYTLFTHLCIVESSTSSLWKVHFI